MGVRRVYFLSIGYICGIDCNKIPTSVLLLLLVLLWKTIIVRHFKQKFLVFIKAVNSNEHKLIYA